MRGFYVERKGGWDCHGLPVEIAVEQQLGITTKDEIEAYGIAEFNAKCRESVFEFLEDWNALTERIGFWVDLDDAYRTLDPDVHRVGLVGAAQICDKGLLYEGHKVVPYCPRCGTALSSHELALGYEDVVDPTVYVRFPVAEDGGPLQARRRAARLDDDAVDARLQRRGRRRPRAHLRPRQGRAARARRSCSPRRSSSACSARATATAVQILARFPGAALDGVRYEPPFPFIPRQDYGERGHTVLLGDFVTADDGTGLVHTAIAFGEDDFRLGEQYGLNVVNPVRLDGTYDERIGPYDGRFVKDADRDLDRGPPPPRPAAARGGVRARLPALLALRHAAALLRQAVLVHRDDEAPRRPAGRQRGGRLAPRAHQARAHGRLAAEQRRLGAVARALLGHAAAGLALRRRPRPRDRLVRRARGALSGVRLEDPHRPYVDDVHFPCPRVQPGR